MYYMSDTISLRLPRDLSDRLNRLADSTSRPKSFYVRSLIEEHLAELEYVAGLDAEVEAIRRGEVKTRPMSELMQELGITQEDIDAAPSTLHASA